MLLIITLGLAHCSSGLERDFEMRFSFKILLLTFMPLGFGKNFLELFLILQVLVYCLKLIYVLILLKFMLFLLYCCYSSV